MRKEVKLEDYLQFSECSEDSIKLCEEVSKYYPAYVSVGLYKNGEDEDWVFDSSTVVLQHPIQRITVWKRPSESKYNICCETTLKLPRVNDYDVRNAKEDLTPPNQIGVFSAKKILNWVNYLEEVYTRVKKVSDERVQYETDFRKSLEQLPDIQWFGDRSSGRVVRNMIEFEFAICDTHISRKIEIHYTADNTVETFIKLSDNGYKNLQ